MNVVSPAHYTSPMGGSLYTRTWRKGIQLSMVLMYLKTNMEFENKPKKTLRKT